MHESCGFLVPLQQVWLNLWHRKVKFDLQRRSRLILLWFIKKLITKVLKDPQSAKTSVEVIFVNFGLTLVTFYQLISADVVKRTWTFQRT